jgi:autotransporter family porin
MGGTVTLNATSGGQLAALLATGASAQITANTTTILNNNNQGSSITFGVNATSTIGAASVILNGGSIVTSAMPGSRAYGINAAPGGTVEAMNLSITTMSANSHAVVAAGGTIDLTGGSITTNGTFSLGLQANSNAGPATIIVNGTTIDTTGTNSSGAVAQGTNAATISLTGATITTSGVGASGLFASGTGKIITANTTNITTGAASSVVADSGANIALTGGTVTLNAASGGQFQSYWRLVINPA